MFTPVSSTNVIFLILASSGIATAQRDSTCTTPNNEIAKCIPVPDCTVIFSAIQTKNASAIEFAQKSQCGVDGNIPLICCGTTAYANTPDWLQYFTPKPDLTPKTTSQAKKELEAIILMNFNTKELPDRTVCGLEKEETRVIGGEQTDLDEFPWMAALEYKKKDDGSNAGVRCGGSIINNRYILTAAHCILDREFELVGVRLGEWKLDMDPDCVEFIANIECAEKVKVFKISEQIAHPFYSKKSGNNDIGLLRLEKDIRYTDFIRPICLPPQNLPIPDFGSNMTVAGWGATENGTSSNVKLKVAVPLLSNNACTEALKKGRPISANQLCAGGERGRDSCQGDSGGPLMRSYEDQLSQQNQWYQEGVVSWGVGCGRPGYPAIYTRVSRYISWIINNISDS